MTPEDSERSEMAKILLGLSSSNTTNVNASSSSSANARSSANTTSANGPTPPTTPSAPVAPAQLPTPTASQQGGNRSRNHKNTPIAARGTRFFHKDNPNVDLEPLKKGKHEPEKLKLKLKSTTGQVVEFKFLRRKGMDFDDATAISDANKWRRQLLRRRLKVTGPTRKAWEKKDIAVITNHPDFRNEYVSETAIKEMMIRLPGRTMTAIRAMLLREKRKLGVESGEISSLEKPSQAKTKEEKNIKVEEEEEVIEEESEKKKKGGDVDPRLEDHSDEEDEGRRPASQPVGGVLVSAC